MTFAMFEFVGLYLLAAAMRPHRDVLLGGWRNIAGPRSLAVIGGLLLALSCGIAVAGHRSTDIVMWFGLLPLACGAILLGLSFAPQLVRAFAVAGLAGGLVAIFLA